jgi:hypothetical protein
MRRNSMHIWDTGLTGTIHRRGNSSPPNEKEKPEGSLNVSCGQAADLMRAWDKTRWRIPTFLAERERVLEGIRLAGLVAAVS